MGSSTIESNLRNGRECAEQLIDIMKQQPSCYHNKSTAKDLLVKIMEILDGTISSLSMSKSTSSTPSNVDSGHVLSIEESKYEDSIFTISPSSSVEFLDRRECKNTRTQERFVKESSTLVDDGHAWRKYGQKNIRDSSHPRDYFRCTNKFDQGCKATKHVQKVQTSPPKYRTVYFGQHTCKNLVTQPQNISSCDHNTILDNDNDDKASVLFSFESTTSTTTTRHGQINTFFPSSSSIEIEHIIDTEERSQHVLSDEFSPPSSYLSPMDMTVVSGELDMSTMSMLLSSDFYEDMIMTQSGNLDVEMNTVPLNYFDDVF